jgi:hypothetical protein
LSSSKNPPDDIFNSKLQENKVAKKPKSEQFFQENVKCGCLKVPYFGL